MTITEIKRSTFVDHCDAVDVFVVVDGIEVEVTLVRSRQDEARWEPYGNDPSMWMDWRLLIHVDDVDAFYDDLVSSLDLTEIERLFN